MTDLAAAWRIAGASSVGASHQASAQECQDRHVTHTILTRDGQVVLLVVASDGAGSATHSAEGAQIAVDAFSHHIIERLRAVDLDTIQDRLPIEALLEARAKVLRRAMADGRDARQYACTLVAAIVGPSVAGFVQIGDGVAVYRTEGAVWRSAIWPQRGEYANETYFLTDEDALARAELFIELKPVNDLAVLTDGLQGQALDPKNRQVIAGFFDPLIATVQRSQNSETGALSPALERFLSSAAVNDLTDDDKTLVLASRSRLTAVGEDYDRR